VADVELITVELTGEERYAIWNALMDYKLETQRYLTPSATQPHDPCCKLEAAREQERQKTTDLLQQRFDTIVSALHKVGEPGAR
jgi:hypothetical protein